jgi:polyphosphate kinase 2
VAERLDKKVYDRELERMQDELVLLQEAVQAEGLRVAVVFEGRDTAGKGGVIQRMMKRLNPRVVHVVALGVPSDRERREWYFQRYVAHVPPAGEIALFDRSWYNRAGVERVMGFCTEEEAEAFLRATPVLERLLVSSGLILMKYWLEVSPDVQVERLRERVDDPSKRWKLSPVDATAPERYDAYSRARDEMMARTDIPEAPWFVVDADDQRRARLNLIQHLLDRLSQRREPEKVDVAVPKPRAKATAPPARVARVPERW